MSMKILTTAMAVAAMMGMTGAAMACGGAAGGKLGKVTVKKIYRTPQTAARNTMAYATNKFLQSNSGGEANILPGTAMKTSLLKKTATSQQLRVTIADKSDDVTGSGRIAVKKVTGGWQGQLLTGHVSASW
jgi:hypothetical protein